MFKSQYYMTVGNDHSQVTDSIPEGLGDAIALGDNRGYGVKLFKREVTNENITDLSPSDWSIFKSAGIAISKWKIVYMNK